MRANNRLELSDTELERVERLAAGVGLTPGRAAHRLLALSLAAAEADPAPFLAMGDKPKRRVCP